MHSLLLTLAIALAGQVTAGSGTRYEPAQEIPTSQPVLPPQPRQSQPRLPAADYRADGRNRGQQPLARPLPAKSPLASNGHVATTAPATTIKPSELIRSLLKPPTTGQLAGSPLSLAEAVEGANSRSEQTRRVEAYWDLSEATANYYRTLREMIALRTMQRSITQPSALWEQTRQSLDQREQAARRSAETAQARMQRMLGRTAGPLPLASDLPHCGAYDTRYDQIFSGRLPAPEAQQLNKLLPLAHQQIRNQAAHVLAAHEWRETVSQRRDPQTDGRALLKAHELLSLSRQTFIQSLRSYNVNIARYAEIASPGQIGTGRLVAMLIYTDASQGSAWNRRGIRRTSGEEAIDRRDSGQPRTFAEEAEHSILTTPHN
ncbi:MAG: hypothetical protein GXP28_02735 [Planctomycetes bacterium]|nr:hypothetical protein [Planctomycetota bacterium]